MSTPTLSAVTANETLPAVTSTYLTTFQLLEQVQGPGPGTSTIESLTTEMVTTTFPASTRTIVLNVPVVTPIAPVIPLSASSGLVTSTVGSNFTSSTATSASLTSTHTMTSAPIGISVLPKPSATNTKVIIAGVVVPLVLIAVAVSLLVLRKWKHREIQNTRRCHPNVKFTPRSKRNNNHANQAPPYGVQNRDQGSYRVASPPRPQRPTSITESVLNVMDHGSGARSDVTERDSFSINFGPLAHLRKPGVSLNDDDMIMPNTDGTPIYDGTRSKYIKTSIEGRFPLETLSRPSVRVPNAAHRTGIERRSYHPGAPSSSFSPEPLHAHKKAASDGRNNMSTLYGTNLEEGRRPSPALTEQEFKNNFKRNFSMTPPLESSTTEHEGLIAEGSSDDGSVAKDYEIAQKRDESLAALEGRTPELVSSEFSPRGPRSEIPLRRRPPITEERRASRRVGNVIDETNIKDMV